MPYGYNVFIIVKSSDYSHMLRVLLFIGAGSFAGGVARYVLSHTVQTGVTSGFPWGTMVVNVLGCFVIGLLNALFERGHVMNTDLRMFLTTGFCGGFTTGEQHPAFRRQVRSFLALFHTQFRTRTVRGICRTVCCQGCVSAGWRDGCAAGGLREASLRLPVFYVFLTDNVRKSLSHMLKRSPVFLLPYLRSRDSEGCGACFKVEPMA